MNEFVKISVYRDGELVKVRGQMAPFYSLPEGEDRIINDKDILKKGTSYNKNMLDLNELVDEGLLTKGDKIDLSQMPEIETIQAATQEQLDMLTDASKEQIKAIHLSNNFVVGWDGEYDFGYEGEGTMDRKLDLSSYQNVVKVETHAYLNDDLEEMVLPKGVDALLFKHSKMENLNIVEQYPEKTVYYDHVVTKDIDCSWEEDLPIVEFYMYDPEEKRYLEEYEYDIKMAKEREDEDKRAVKARFENIENQDGSYNIYDHTKGNVIAYNLTGQRISLGVGKSSWDFDKRMESFALEGTDQKVLLVDGVLYKADYSKQPEGVHLYGNPDTNSPFALVKLTNMSNPKEVKHTIELSSYYSDSKFSMGIVRHSRYDSAAADHWNNVWAFQPSEDGFVNPDSICVQRGWSCNEAKLIVSYFANAEKNNLNVSPEDAKGKIAYIMRAGDPEKKARDIYRFCSELVSNANALSGIRKTLGSEMKYYFQSLGIYEEFKDCLERKAQKVYNGDVSGVVVADEIAKEIRAGNIEENITPKVGKKWANIINERSWIKIRKRNGYRK